jgi:membrane-associated phospholipid phosphatase
VAGLKAWLPLPILFATYQLAGWIGRRLARPSADGLLHDWDRRLFGVDPGVWMVQHWPAAALGFLDLFYLSYYVLLVVGPWVMLARYGESALRRMWLAVGLAYLICYLLFPWFPSTPPRLLFPEFAYGGGAQTVNLWVLDRFSVGGNVFPSAHVAAGFSFGACHWQHDRRLGSLFLLWGAGIGIATVSGGYHYGVDAVAGALVGVCAALSRPNRFIRAA